jgi:hypothetical protein
MRGALDTFTRFVMLVLAGLVSLSIIGAIDAMSSREGGGFVIETRPPPTDRLEPTAENRAAPVEQGGIAAPTGQPGTAAAAAPAPQRDETDRWLEAIAYALIALVGVLALIALILWRGLAAIADR